MKILTKIFLILFLKYCGSNYLMGKDRNCVGLHKTPINNYTKAFSKLPSPPIIGHVVSGVPYFIANLSTLKTQWEAYLLTIGISVNLDLTTFQLYHDSVYDVYSLRATNIEGTIKCAVALILNGNNNLIEIPNGGGVTVTCNGCSNGCSPRIDDNGKGCCTACTVPGPCSQSVINGGNSVFY